MAQTPAQAEASRRYRELHPDKVKVQQQEYHAANREQRLAANAEWYRRNREATRLRKARERAADPEHERAKRAAYYAKNRDKIKERVRMRKLESEGGPEAKAYGKILLKDPCVYCGGETEQIDHIHPLKLGGSSDWDNLTAACKSCNSSKQATPLLHFLLDAAARASKKI